MVWTSILIQNKVPIYPCHSPAIKIVYNGSGVTFTKVPGSYVRTILLASFSKNQFLIRKVIVDLLYCVKMITIVPMESRTPDVFCRFRVIEHSPGSFYHNIPVMIPYYHFFIQEIFVIQCRP